VKKSGIRGRKYYREVMQTSVNPLYLSAVRNWLMICVGLVALMVVVGGLTRLTESGLSIVEWKPLSGTFPPFTEAGWQAEFEEYKTSPQYQKVNAGMSLAEFKGIFWLEYLHRLLGRVIGLVFFFPFAFFVWKKAFDKATTLKLGGIFLLGGLQGLVGWLMVKSGLVDTPAVSPIKLAMHLGIAFIIFALLLWQVLRLTDVARKEQRPAWLVGILVAAVYIQTLLGALVAGLDAGLIYNTFPTMGGQWMPTEIGYLQPWYLDLTSNPVTAQWVHRVGALLLTLLILSVFWRIRPETLNHFGRKMRVLLPVLLLVQIVLGILTVVHHVPIVIATLHQFGALLLFANALALLYATQQRYPQPELTGVKAKNPRFSYSKA
jgi:heme a synthase